MQANVDINLAAHPHLQGEMSEIGFSACTKFHQNDSLDARTERIKCAPLAWGDMEQSGAISKADLVLVCPK